MSTTVKVQIQQRIDTASAWTTANPTLLAGEVGWESDTKKYKIGDGSTAWASLAYAPGSGGYTAGTGVSISGSNVITASAIALSTIQTAANETAMLALTTQEGDVVVRSDQSKTYMKNNGTANSMADFTELSTPTDAVTSVNGNTGAITADQLAAAIESATDSNKFTDADHTKLNSALTTSDLLDEDNFATNSATKAASQQSVKAYVDANAANTTYAISCVDGDNTDEEKIRLTAGGSGSGTDDIVLEAGTGLSIARSSDKITFTNTVSNTDTQLTEEQVEDFVGGMLTGNTETGITVTYQDSDGTIDFVVDLLDEDDFASNSATVAPSQQSVKAYVDTADALKANLGANTFTGSQSLGDNLKVQIGTGNDLQLYHDGSSSYVYDNGTGPLILGTNNSNIQIKGAGSMSAMMAEFKSTEGVELYFDGTKRVETTSTGVTVNGKAVVGGNLELNSDAYLKIGAGSDLQLFHTGSHSYLDFITGNLNIRDLNGNSATFAQDGAVELFFDNTKRVETTSTGARIHVNTGASALFTNQGQAPEIQFTANSVANAGEIKVAESSNGGVFIVSTKTTGGTLTQALQIGTDQSATFAGTVSDSKGNLRSIPNDTKTSAYTLVASDAGKCIRITTGGVTVPNSVFAEGDAVSIINQSGSNQTITAGSGFTLYNAGDGSAGSRTLAGRGMVTMMFAASDAAYISGAGLS